MKPVQTIPPDGHRPISLSGELTMVVHGPAVFDRGAVKWLADNLSPNRIVVAGVMARTAAEESGLPVQWRDGPPSAVIGAEKGPVILVNWGKDPRSGYLFGEEVASRLGTDRGLVHIECSDRTVYLWNGAGRALGTNIAERTEYRLLSVKAAPSPRKEGERLIRGCCPGEWVYVNGTVVGRATAEEVMLRLVDGTIEPVTGLLPKPHGIEKLERNGPIDLASAWCKSGPLRTVQPQQVFGPPREGRVLVIDHCGHDLYRRLEGDVCGILSIGDDTTAVCGHICSHLGIPVFGIVDGDRDGIVEDAYPPRSVVVEVIDGRDDDTGIEIARTIDDRPQHWDAWVRKTLQSLNGTTRIVHNTYNDHEAVH